MTTETFPSVVEIRKRIDTIPKNTKHGIIYQNAFRYLYLIAGRVSEVVGKYSPLGEDALKTQIDGIDAVIFPVKTARKKGSRRPVAIPLSPYYEKWAGDLYEWFKVHGGTNPFGVLTSRSYQRMASIVFKDIKWPVEDYHKTIRTQSGDSRVIYERPAENGETEYLVEYRDLERRWVKDPRTKAVTIVRERHWNNFSLQSLRHQRIRELKYNYGFTENEIKTYTGLIRTDGKLSRTFDRYDFVNPQNDEIQVEALIYASKNYFQKLLIHQD